MKTEYQKKVSPERPLSTASKPDASMDTEAEKSYMYTFDRSARYEGELQRETCDSRGTDDPSAVRRYVETNPHSVSHDAGPMRITDVS